MFVLPLLSLAFTTSGILAVSTLGTDIQISGCDVSGAQLTVPAGLPQPTATTSFIAVAIGVQNYTCGNTGTFTSVGALAELFDISCLVGDPLFAEVQTIFYEIWKDLPADITTDDIIAFFHNATNSDALGQHYFIDNPISGSGISPEWDFTSQGATKGNPDAFVVGAVTADIPAPTGPQDIDWLSLTGVEGDLASQIYRVDTVAGQPPASCTAGTTASVKYASKYWLFGGSISQSS